MNWRPMSTNAFWQFIPVLKVRKKSLQVNYVNAGDGRATGLALCSTGEGIGEYGQKLFMKLATVVSIVYKHPTRIPKA